MERGLAAVAHRGPDATDTQTIGDVTLGHTRLALVDLTSASNQPFTYGKTTVAFNGEIWNFRELRSSLIERGLGFATSGDVEVLAAVLDEYGMSGLEMLEGMFAIAWTDGNTLWAARDRFGEAPLHVCLDQGMVGSELKALMAAGSSPQSIRWVPPGTAVELLREPRWVRWYQTPRAVANLDRTKAAAKLRSLLAAGCTDRSLADVPVCTLLSGGIDSSAIAYLVRDKIPGLVAYTAVFDPGSPDLIAAREAAGSIDIALREVRVEAPSADDLKSVVKAIEMPFKPQIEIAWACLRLAEVIRADGFKVVLSGEGSDELWASYDFSRAGIRRWGWDGYRRRLMYQMSYMNFPRSNKVFMQHSVECRMPFLSTGMAEFALSLPHNLASRWGRPKALMQEAFRDALPRAVLKRKKLPFHRGLGLDRELSRSFDDAGRMLSRVFRETYRGNKPKLPLESLEV